MSADNDPWHVLVIHGPNMNLIGKRPRQVFGTLTLDKINRSIRRQAHELGVQLKIFQSNSESDIVTKLQRQRKWADGIFLNPSTLCFSSYTLLDTLELIGLPTVEVHLTQTLAGRDVSESLLKSQCISQIVGPVDDAYRQGLDTLITNLQ
ncbi:MAG: 3-dehydroquinate dehydratase [Candidatus Marinimicrobia bacterium]|nr:3-dehydroquinate dehydratase [Candidatus Neomarinimicrobiota bacterium]